MSIWHLPSTESGKRETLAGSGQVIILATSITDHNLPE